MDELSPWVSLAGSNALSVTLAKRAGHDDGAVEMAYHLDPTPTITVDNWVQLRLDFPGSQDISQGDLLRLWFRGTPNVTNSLEIGLVEDLPGQPILGRQLNQVTQIPAWTYATISYDAFRPWTAAITQTSGQLEGLFISTVKLNGTEDVGGGGAVAIDGIQILNSISRPILTAYEPVNGDPVRAAKAVAWIADQQQSSGLVRSWEGETPGRAWLYDQALAGAAWLKTCQLQFPDGRVHNSTEANLDAWWAFQATHFTAEAARVRDYLLTEAWRVDQQRWQRGYQDPIIVLDTQTWGAAFAKAVGEPERGLAALSFAEYTLASTDFSGVVRGLDGAGPFSVWNEGPAQYVVAGGRGAQAYLDELRRQQRSDGAMPGSPDDFRSATVWLTTWHGIAPTAWLYFAEAGGPFHPTPPESVPGLLVQGPAAGQVNTTYRFEARINSLTATVILPLTYTWQATEQNPLTQTNNPSDTVSFTWDQPGAKAITVTAANGYHIITGSYHLILDLYQICLPLISKAVPYPVLQAVDNQGNDNYTIILGFRTNMGDTLIRPNLVEPEPNKKRQSQNSCSKNKKLSG